MVGPRTLVLPLVAAVLIVGVLLMHGLARADDGTNLHGEPDRSTMSHAAATGTHDDGDLAGTADTDVMGLHLLDVCLWVLVAGFSTAGTVRFLRRPITGRETEPLVAGAQAVRTWSGPAPPRAPSNLQLGVVLQ